jgi:hypothetical protein
MAKHIGAHTIEAKHASHAVLVSPPGTTTRLILDAEDDRTPGRSLVQALRAQQVERLVGARAVGQQTSERTQRGGGALRVACTYYVMAPSRSAATSASRPSRDLPIPAPPRAITPHTRQPALG